MRNYRPHYSYDFDDCDPIPRDQLIFGQFRGHGTHVAGLLAATADNFAGVAAGCRDCSLQVSKALQTIDGSVNAFTWAPAPYSWRSATIGSTRQARLAGTQQAASATPARIAAVAASTPGSVGAIP